jgi:hypothetical protein
MFHVMCATRLPPAIASFPPTAPIERFFFGIGLAILAFLVYVLSSLGAHDIFIRRDGVARLSFLSTRRGCHVSRQRATQKNCVFLEGSNAGK